MRTTGRLVSTRAKMVRSTRHKQREKEKKKYKLGGKRKKPCVRQMVGTDVDGRQREMKRFTS